MSLTHTSAPGPAPAAPAAVPAAPSAAAARPAGTPGPLPSPDHLDARRWAAANRHLVRKAIAEFSHERILTPVPDGEGTGPSSGGAGGLRGYRLVSDDGAVEYRFRARILDLEHWSVDAGSIRRIRGGQDVPPDALDFITEFAATLGIRDKMLPVYLEELSATLASHAFKQSPDRPGSAELAAGVTGGTDPAADFQAVEQAMSEGHPCFVANNGRHGFGRGDFLAYAPEAGAPVHLAWIAGRADRTEFNAVDTLTYRRHLAAELGPELLAHFESRLAARGLDPQAYLLIPVHPWQWEHKLTVTFAADIAEGHLVPLGTGPDSYQAQQSIRTFFNRDRPAACYVKTALSVVNMGFMRGLSSEYMRSTPAINQWVADLAAGDAVLRDTGFEVLREVAAVGYTNRHLQAAAPKGSAYRKMLAALWRESPLPRLRDGEQLATMASLLHVDRDGQPLAAALIRRSGLPARRWLGSYLRAYLVPLLHCFYAYDLAFMPHGENVILALRNGVPERVFMKDIGEEVIVMGDAVPLPEAARRIRIEIPEEEKVLSLFTDVFDCFLRFLAAILAEEGLLDADGFWSAVADVVLEYQREHPELAERFAAHDLFAADFARSCLNRLQLRDNQQMLDISDPSGGLQFSGRLANPLARYRPAA